ncbi:restriction endonuclease [Blastococcus sp. KM273128]|nr:restriction endonuclease [Blastococcus sp. KM273128]
MSFEGLDATDFEDFCHDLLIAQGFVNVDWRKGTPKQASPSDRGRDLVAQLERRDVDGHVYHETWFVDCKHYKTGVPPEALQGLATWGLTERPDVALVIASGFLSNPAKDWIAQYQTNNRPPFRFRYWERPQLSGMIAKDLDIAWQHSVSVSSLRSIADIMTAENEMFEKVWYGRKPQDGDFGRPVPEEILAGMRKAMADAEAKYGKDELMRHMESDFAWGMLSGKLSTLRWVLGEDWDMLDT